MRASNIKMDDDEALKVFLSFLDRDWASVDENIKKILATNSLRFVRTPRTMNHGLLDGSELRLSTGGGGTGGKHACMRAFPLKITARTLYTPTNGGGSTNSAPSIQFLELPVDWLNGLTAAEQKQMKNVRFVVENGLSKLTEPIPEVSFEDLCEAKINGKVIQQRIGMFPADIAKTLRNSDKMESIPGWKWTTNYFERVVFPREKFSNDIQSEFLKIGYIGDVTDFMNAQLGNTSLCRVSLINPSGIALTQCKVLAYHNSRVPISEAALDNPKGVNDYLQRNSSVIEMYLKDSNEMEEYLRKEHSLLQKSFMCALQQYKDQETLSPKAKGAMDILIKEVDDTLRKVNKKNVQLVENKKREAARNDPRVALKERLEAEEKVRKAEHR